MARRFSPRLFRAAAALLFTFAPPTASAQQPRARSDTIRDLRNVLTTGYILQDRNHDDVIDFVNVKIVVPVARTEADLAAAANIAARLGYETSATNLDLVALDSERTTGYDVPVILIGSHNALVSRGGATLERSISGLAPGQGAAVLIRPNSYFRQGGVLIAGNDATGLIAVSNYFVSRYPSVWAVRGSSYTDVGDRLTTYLDQQSVRVDGVSLDRIVIDASRRGVGRVDASVRVADSAAFARAVAALSPTDSATGDSTGAGRGAGAGRGGGRGAGAVAGDSTAPGGGRGRLRRADLQFADLDRLDVEVSAGDRRTVVHITPARPWQTRPGNEFAARGSPDFTLSDIYSIRGLFQDTNGDLVPDRTDAFISLHGTESPRGIATIAERIGLETAGMRLPFVRVGGEDESPQDAGFPIIYGIGHYQIDRLKQAGKLHGNVDKPGEGFIQFARGDFGGRNGLVIGASDKAGLDAISDYVARRMPNLWEYGKGNYGLSDVETETRRFFQAREAPGQTALAVYKLGVWLDRLKGKDIDSVGVEISAKERYEGLDRYATQLIHARFPNAKATVLTRKTGFGVGKPIFTDERDLPWEVDAFWKAFRGEALPKLSAKSQGRIDVRLSESPEIRARITQDIRRELQSKGITKDAFDVEVLSAYKQGYSWLYDEILPKLKGQHVGRIEITYHTLKDSREVKWQVVESDTRWLQELYPIDAILARELGIPDSAITFTPTQKLDPIYTVRALASNGNEILHASFTPKYVERPMFDLFPEYEHVRVTTGWANVTDNGRTVLDQRIKTDPETFWDYFQTDTYKKITDYTMDIQDGRPSQNNAPFFDELTVNLTMSEPNYRLGLDEEVISSLEAIHEDIYFETLTLFDLIGGRYGAGQLTYPGRVIPIVHPSVEGKPGHVKVTFTGKDHGVPELVLAYRARGHEPVKDKYPLAALPTEAPKLRGITARAEEQGVSQLLFDVTAIDSGYKYEDYKLRGAEEANDRTLLPAELLIGMVRAMDDLHKAGVAEDALSFDRVREMLFRVALRDSAVAYSRLVSLPRSGHPMSTRTPVLLDKNFRYTGQRIVQWDTPIPPAESDSILSKLATFPVVKPYFMAKSFLGQNIFAADFLPPTEAKFVSQAKLNALKPTLLLSGRQHANEVSSTSYILRLGELIATDTNYTKLLRKVNVVLHPITNADGARLAYDLQKISPDFMLHAGYLGALGVDATTGANTEDPIYPESRVRPRLQEMWLPDIFMNLHGYPSHEWVQLFEGYSGWVRGRTGTQRQWLSPRGWFVPGFSYVDDRRNPEFKTAQFAILDSVAKAITGTPAVDSMNKRLYARYQKYGKQDTENFREYFQDGILVYESLRGTELAGGAGGADGGADALGAAPAAGGGRGAPGGRGGGGGGGAGGGVNSPRVTYFSVTTESPDETARGDWMKLVASAGLTETSALLRYLATGVNDVRRDVAEYEGVVTRSVARRKPVTPKPPARAAGRAMNP
jgi:hypothetical protein